MTLAIDVHDLVKRYGPRTVVDHVDLAVEQGRICGFLGPNGSGKTTTLRMICGLLTPDGGGGTCLGHDLVREREAIKRQTGYMTQRFGLYEDLTIRENLEFVGRVYGLDRLKQRVDGSLERLELSTRQNQLAGAWGYFPRWRVWEDLVCTGVLILGLGEVPFCAYLQSAGLAAAYFPEA